MNTLHTPPARSLKTLLIACACLLAAVAPARAQDRVMPAGPVRRADDSMRAHELLWKGRQLLERKDDKGALDVFRDAVKQFPDVSDAWYDLGVALRRTGDFDEAVQSLARALKLRRDSTTVRAELAYALMLAGKQEQAIKEARRAFDEDAPDSASHYLVGMLYLNHAFPADDAPSRALEEAEAAVAADANFARAHLLKAQALIRLSSTLSITDERDVAGQRLAEAAQSLEKFLALAPSADANQFWQQQLSALRGQSEALRAPGASRAVFSPKELTAKAVITSRPEPMYAEGARRTQTFGSVRVRLVLAADGSVQHVLALGTLPNGLTERAVEAARAIQFKPATLNGNAVSQLVTIDYNFNIF
jgi:TonB family protein